MPESIADLELLFATWQKNPDVSRTIAMCDALRGTKRADLVEIVGNHAAGQVDVRALTAAARMYADTGRLEDARQVLIGAGRLAPRDGDVYLMLGEVLLRRGDADQAEMVLQRAVQLGTNPIAEAWLDRARALKPTQRSSGMMAVAEEIRRELNDVQGRGAASEPPDSESEGEIETQIRKNPGVQAALAAAGRPAIPAPPARRPLSSGEPGSADRSPTGRTGAALPAALGPPIRGARPAGLAPIDTGSFDDALGKAFNLPAFDSGDALGDGAPQTANVALPSPERGAVNASAMGLGTAPFASAGAVNPGSRPPPPLPASALSPPALEVNPLLLPPRAPKPTGPNGRPMPEARDVLEALQISGVFEPDGAVRPQAFNWDKPRGGKRRIGSYASLIALAALTVGGSIGAYRYVTDKRAKQHLESETLLAQIDGDLDASDANLFEPSEKSIATAFDLDSRSPHAALTWLHERAMVGLLRGGENVAFEDGAARAKEVLVDEKHLAFTYAASFLFQGDTAGAASALAKWDGKADDDAWYQLIAGATFERAGDARALERYAAAVKLDPGLVVAQILLARATAVDGDPRHAAALAKEFRTKYPARIEGTALVALAWARDSMRSEPPPEAKEIADKGDLLPTPLKAVAPAVRALLAIEQHKTEDAKAALTKGLAVADTPGIAAWLGGIALATEDEGLARKGALVAVSYSAVYPPARMLAARVALLGARLDEALKATEELPTTSPDVAIVTASVAYEKLDGERMRSALDGLPDDVRKLPFLIPLVRGQALLGGNARALGGDTALAMAEDEAPWADLVAMDSALDSGDVELSRKIAARWKTEPKALRAVRLSRLARWEGKNEDADRLSRLALEGGTVTVRALAERVFVLVAMNKPAEALTLFKAYPNVGGPLAKWLRAYAVASHGKMEEARALISQDDPPPALAPLPARMIAAAAYGAVKDTRKGGDYVRAVLQAGFANPDMIVAAEKLGAGKIVRPR